jgi:hypothetical protein
LNIEISLNAQVECTDGACGHSKYVLINPVIDLVTHLVVKEDVSPQTEYIVPIDFVAATIANLIQLRCSKAEMEKMEPFISTTFIEEKVPDINYRHGGRYGLGSIYYMPYVTPEVTVYESVKWQQIPPGELAVRRGAHIEATDGYVGIIDEFVINRESGHITHLVMREGHLWGKKDVIIPISAMDDKHHVAGSDSLFLKLNKREVESLPTFPLHRHWA